MTKLNRLPKLFLQSTEYRAHKSDTGLASHHIDVHIQDRIKSISKFKLYCYPMLAAQLHSKYVQPSSVKPSSSLSLFLFLFHPGISCNKLSIINS